MPKEDVTSCGQLDTNNIVFTIFGGNWNREKNKEYPPNRTPAFTKAATTISNTFGLCCNKYIGSRAKGGNQNKRWQRQHTL